MATLTTDVLVIGAGVSGVPAAIGAARAGARVVLVEEDARPGGAPVDNYITMPCGLPRLGVYREMLDRLNRDHRLPVEQAGPIPPLWDRWFMPGSCQVVIETMLKAEPTITLLCRTALHDVITEKGHGGPRVAGAVVNRPAGQQLRVNAAVTIDATGTGDVAAKAISISHLALSAYRVQPSVATTGQAAGIAAALCVETKCLPHDVVPSRLKPRLQQQALTPSPSRSEGNAGPGQSQ